MKVAFATYDAPRDVGGCFHLDAARFAAFADGWF
jgi:hypothetical protein